LLIIAGLQVPVMPLFEVAGRIGATVPEQKAGMAVNAGVMIGLTVTFRLAVVAHCPAAGVKV
jgi:hypothetical protein